MEHAHIFNLCEKGIFLIPIGYDAGGCKAYADLCTFIPVSDIRSLSVEPDDFPKRTGMEMILRISSNVVWDIHFRGNDLFSESSFAYQVHLQFDGEPFHEANVRKLCRGYGNLDIE